MTHLVKQEKLFSGDKALMQAEIYLIETAEKNPDFYFTISFPTDDGVLVTGIPKQQSFDFMGTV